MNILPRQQLGGKFKMPRIAVPGMGYLGGCSDREQHLWAMGE